MSPSEAALDILESFLTGDDFDSDVVLTSLSSFRLVDLNVEKDGFSFNTGRCDRTDFCDDAVVVVVDNVVTVVDAVAAVVAAADAAAAVSVFFSVEGTSEIVCDVKRTLRF